MAREVDVKGPEGIPQTDTQASAASATATESAVSGVGHKVLGFSGSSNDQNYKVELKIDGAVKMTLHGTADMSQGVWFGPFGPKGGDNVPISVVTTPDSTGQCTANLITYREGV